MNPNLEAPDALYSSLADDPDLTDIVEMFVEEMPGRIASLLEQCEAGEWELLRRTAHQLKGAAGSYGFELISPVAGHVEDMIRQASPEDQIRQSVSALIAMCRACRVGAPSADSSAMEPS